MAAFGVSCTPSQSDKHTTLSHANVAGGIEEQHGTLACADQNVSPSRFSTRGAVLCWASPPRLARATVPSSKAIPPQAGRSPMDLPRATEHYRAALEALGLTPGPDLDETAQRSTALLAEWIARAGDHTTPRLSLFPAPANTDWVVVHGLSLHSFCEHHMVPFFGYVDLAYLPTKSVVGFSGFARLVDHYARRPQLQERIGSQVADAIWETAAPSGVLIRITARQLCAELRGIANTMRTVTYASRGVCEDAPGRAAALAALGDATPSAPSL